MLFHAARLESRIDSRGSLLLLEDQDRRLWDRRMMAKATEFLNLSAEGPRVTPYHIEAGICMLHCAAPSFAETDWPAILGLYDRLLSLSRSPVYVLNRSIVVAQIDGPLAGIRALAEALDDPALAEYHLLDCTLGELHRRAGDMASARRHFEAARRKTASRFDRELIDRRLASCG
jgi:RNA polymerase sigma-70 factor (ECF subfamily)